MLNEKLKELRLSNSMTQEEVAQSLGVSSQTVSKWERGLLSPDISLLPKISALYGCSIDSLFGMQAVLTKEKRLDQSKILRELMEKGDWAGEYRFWMKRIEENPYVFSNHLSFMSRVLEKRAFDRETLLQLELLCGNADSYCEDKDILTAMHYTMVQIFGETADTGYSFALRKHYDKLPSMHYGRERLAKYLLLGEELKKRNRGTFTLLLGQLDTTVNELIDENMPSHEKLYYLKKSSEVFEVILDGKYGGFYEIPLFDNYYKIALILLKDNKNSEAGFYAEKIFSLAQRHMTISEKTEYSKLLYNMEFQLDGKVEPLFTTVKRILENIQKEFSEYKEKATDLLTRYIEYFNT